MIPERYDKEVKKNKDNSNKDADIKESLIESTDRCSRCGSTNHYDLSCIYSVPRNKIKF